MKTTESKIRPASQMIFIPYPKIQIIPHTIYKPVVTYWKGKASI